MYLSRRRRMNQSENISSRPSTHHFNSFPILRALETDASYKVSRSTQPMTRCLLTLLSLPMSAHDHVENDWVITSVYVDDLCAYVTFERTRSLFTSINLSRKVVPVASGHSKSPGNTLSTQVLRTRGASISSKRAYIYLWLEISVKAHMIPK